MLDLSRVPRDAPLRMILGAGDQRYPGWIATHREDLDLLDRADWESSFAGRLADAFLCEHVWEHFTEEEGRCAASLCFDFLRPGGYLRCAVPDGNFCDENYQKIIRVGGPGLPNHPAADHKIVYDHRLFVEVFANAGFEVDLLEYCDDNGRFHYNQWDPADGPIYRSLLSDHRNQGSTIGFVSLIADFWKPSHNPVSVAVHHLG